MKAFLQFITAICLIFALVVGAGTVWLVYKGVEVAGDGVAVVQKEGLKGLGTRLWCGEQGCK